MLGDKNNARGNCHLWTEKRQTAGSCHDKVGETAILGQIWGHQKCVEWQLEMQTEERLENTQRSLQCWQQL